MTTLLHELLVASADRAPEARALKHRRAEFSYESLATLATHFARGLVGHGLARQERVAVYLPKCVEKVATIFGAALAGGVFVPVNPLLKPPQVGHILRDCAVRVLVTTAKRASELAEELAQCPDLRTLVVVDGTPPPPPGKITVSWEDFRASMEVCIERWLLRTRRYLSFNVW